MLTGEISTLNVVKYIQGVSVGKVNILGGDSTGNCKERKCT